MDRCLGGSPRGRSTTIQYVIPGSRGTDVSVPIGRAAFNQSGFGERKAVVGERHTPLSFPRRRGPITTSGCRCASWSLPAFAKLLPVVMDPGLAPCAPREDDGNCGRDAATH